MKKLRLVPPNIKNVKKATKHPLQKGLHVQLLGCCCMKKLDAGWQARTAEGGCSGELDKGLPSSHILSLAIYSPNIYGSTFVCLSSIEQ